MRPFCERLRILSLPVQRRLNANTRNNSLTHEMFGYSNCSRHWLSNSPRSNMPAQSFRCLACSKEFKQRGSLIRHRSHISTCGAQRLKHLNRLVQASGTYTSPEPYEPEPPDTHAPHEGEVQQDVQMRPPSSTPVPQPLPINSPAPSEIPRSTPGEDDSAGRRTTRCEAVNST